MILSKLLRPIRIARHYKFQPWRSISTSKTLHNKNVSLSHAVIIFSSLSISLFAYSLQDKISNDSKKTSKHQIIIIEDVDDDIDDDNEEESDEEKEERLENERLERIKNKPHISQIFNISDFEYVAKQVLPGGTWGYYSTGSDDEFSLRENHYAFGRIFFRPKCLVDVNNASLETDEIFGSKFDAPFYVSAFSGSPMSHPDAEKNLLNGCGIHNVPYLIPFQCSFPLDSFVKESREGQSSFHQIHFFNDKQLKDAPRYLKNIEVNHPEIKAFFINVDLPCIGNREKDNKIRSSLDKDINEDLAVFAASTVSYYNITWDDIKKLKDSTKIPIVLKGVLRKEDVLKAAEVGLGGCLISNHGGRQLDFAMPPIEILAQSRSLLRENGIKDKDFKLFIDGGIRRGSDIIKALCLGADAVGMGRPFLYAMASYGQPGVEKAMQILKDEMLRDMKLLGVNSLNELNEDMVDIESLKFKGISSSDHLYNSNYTNMPPPPFKK